MEFRRVLFRSNLVLDRCRLRIIPNLAECRHRGAKPAQPHPHFVHALGISRQQGRRVAGDLLQATAADRTRALRHAHLRMKIGCLGLCWMGARAVDEVVAAFSLAFYRKSSRQRLDKAGCQLEQRLLLAALELELKLAQRLRLLAGINPALVQRYFDAATIAAKTIDPSLHPRLEDRLELSTQLGVKMRPRRVASRQAEIGLVPGDLVLPFTALEQRGTRESLDRLDMPISDPAHAKQDAVLAELLLVGVEVDRNGLLGPGGSLQLAQDRKRLQMREACRRQFEL